MLQLADEDGINTFTSAYSEYGLVDLWLNVSDEHVQPIVDCGLATIPEETLQCGIPLGMFVLGDVIDDCLQNNPNRKLVLCKVALGRSLPTTSSTLSACPDAALPAGYHSLCLITEGDYATRESDNAEEELKLNHGITLGTFKHNFIIPNASLVLPTHYVSFTVEDSYRPNMDSSAVDLMPLLQVRPDVLNSAYREQITSVCDATLVAKMGSQNDLNKCVDESYHALWSELDSLATGLSNLEETLNESSGSVETFKAESFQKADDMRTSMVTYLAHSTQVSQYIKDSQFEINRLISDVQRLQELHHHLYQTLSKEQFLMCWRELDTMRNGMGNELNKILDDAPMHEHTMALTDQNKRIIGLRRKNLLRDELIERLAESLRMRGALKAEDEELISGF